MNVRVRVRCSDELDRVSLRDGNRNVNDERHITARAGQPSRTYEHKCCRRSPRKFELSVERDFFAPVNLPWAIVLSNARAFEDTSRRN